MISFKKVYLYSGGIFEIQADNIFSRGIYMHAFDTSDLPQVRNLKYMCIKHNMIQNYSLSWEVLYYHMTQIK